MEQKLSILSQNSNLPSLIVLIGIPGSGKSHWILTNNISHSVVCPDKIRNELFGDITDQSNNSRVFDIAKGMVIALLTIGKNVIVDATNVNTFYRKDFLNNLPSCNKIAVLFDADPEIASNRIKNDIQNNKIRSNVPEHVIYRMYGEYLFTKKAIQEEGFNHIKIIK